jgi:hypothetical protein
MKQYNHIIDRNLIEWGSYGKFGNKPLRKTLVKDLSDSHLLRIIEHIKMRKLSCDESILKLMEEEAKFRTENFIFIPETYD